MEPRGVTPSVSTYALHVLSTLHMQTVLHAGLLKKKSLDGGHITMEAVFTQQQGTYERGLVQQLQAAAADDWWRPGHPGWAIWPADSEHFLRQVQTFPAVTAECLG